MGSTPEEIDEALAVANTEETFKEYIRSKAPRARSGPDADDLSGRPGGDAGRVRAGDGAESLQFLLTGPAKTQSPAGLRHSIPWKR